MNGLLNTLLFCLVVLVVQGAAQNGDLRDYCHGERFHASCGDDAEIVMVTARYGRMTLGRCVKRNFGYVGCFANVLPIMNSQCAGKGQCQVQVDPNNFEGYTSCPKDLASYLEASYRCETTAIYSTSAGHSWFHVDLWILSVQYVLLSCGALLVT